jgi:hypothetical protein
MTESCRCGGALEPGFIPDFTQGAVWATTWIKGAPERGKSFKELVTTGAGVRASGTDVRFIDAMRCVSCGRLELFAREKPDPSTTPVRER